MFKSLADCQLAYPLFSEYKRVRKNHENQIGHTVRIAYNKLVALSITLLDSRSIYSSCRRGLPAVPSIEEPSAMSKNHSEQTLEKNYPCPLYPICPIANNLAFRTECLLSCKLSFSRRDSRMNSTRLIPHYHVEFSGSAPPHRTIDAFWINLNLCQTSICDSVSMFLGFHLLV